MRAVLLHKHSLYIFKNKKKKPIKTNIFNKIKIVSLLVCMSAKCSTKQNPINISLPAGPKTQK